MQIIITPSSDVMRQETTNDRSLPIQFFHIYIYTDIYVYRYICIFFFHTHTHKHTYAVLHFIELCVTLTIKRIGVIFLLPLFLWRWAGGYQTFWQILSTNNIAFEYNLYIEFQYFFMTHRWIGWISWDGVSISSWNWSDWYASKVA